MRDVHDVERMCLQTVTVAVRAQTHIGSSIVLCASVATHSDSATASVQPRITKETATAMTITTTAAVNTTVSAQ